MAAIITKDIRIHNAKQFVEAPGESANTLTYLFIGKPSEWTTEGSPDVPTDTFRSQVDIWNNMVALKRVTENDVVICIPRNSWATGTVYSKYDDQIPASNLFASNYVVINSAYSVYKCLQNTSAASTIEPTGTGATGNNLIYSADGYTWKYMYNISTLNWTKFGTSTFIPVIPEANVKTDAGNTTGIYSYKIVSANIGSGAIADSTVLTIAGTGTGANANIRVTNGNVTAVNVLAAGTGYTYANVTTNIGNAIIEPIITPPGGHGYDAYDELGGIYAMVNVRLEQTDTDIPVTGAKFRQIGLIKEPHVFGSNILATAATLKAFRTITIDGSISNPGSVLAGSTMVGSNGSNVTIVNYSGNVVNYIQTRTTSSNVLANFKTPIVGETFTIAGASIGSAAALGNSTVALNTGEIMYVDNRNVISRASDQVESLYVVLEF